MTYITVQNDGRPTRIELGLRFTVSDGFTGSEFQLLGHQGGGGNGTVFRARMENGNTCAVKVLRQLDDKRRDRFNNEVSFLKELNHECISSYYGCGLLASGGFEIPWVAMDLGGDNLRRHVQTQGPLPPQGVLHVGIQMADALVHLHESATVHRDLKPANFVWREGSATEVMMIDFGIAKKVGSDTSGRYLDDLTTPNEHIGPANWFSPELIAYGENKSHPVDQRSDLFQFGKVMWWLATGVVTAGVPSRRRDPTGGWLHELVLDLLPDDPDDRVQTAQEVLERLNALADGPNP